MFNMDQGIAAVVAAGAASVVTLAGSAIAYQAGRRQVRDQGAIEHAHWLRGQREQAYLSFLASCERAAAAGRSRRNLVDEIESASADGGTAQEEVQASARRAAYQFSEAVDQILEPLNRIKMLGPEVVIDEAEYTLETVRQFEDSMSPPGRGDPYNAEGDLRVQRAQFAAVARQVLMHPQENITVMVSPDAFPM